MPGYSLSVLELSRIIEEAFLPDHCQCSSPDGLSLSIQITPHNEQEKALSVVGIPLAELSDSRSIARLVLELREELKAGSAMRTGIPQRAGE